MKQIIYHRSGIATDNTAETSKLVPVTYYDVSVTSRLAKYIQSAATFC